MEIVRAVRMEDLDSLMELISRATEGLTTLQLTHEQMLERVERSQFAFTRKSQAPAGEPYVLVMEETETGRIVGTSTLYAKTGGYEPFYAYRLQTETHHSASLPDISTVHRTLHLERIYEGPSEIGSLFLLRAFRGQGRGRLLSLARFALLAQRPHRFADRVIAEMRGRCDAAGVSPFWKSVMRPFFGTEFKTADALSTVSKTFIEDMIPRHPLYVDLLPTEATEVIGCVHDETRPAIALLESEGFAKTDWIDIFDAGPVMECPVERIDAVRRCRRAVVSIDESHTETKSAAPEDGRRQILASQSGGFRAVLAAARQDGQRIHLREETAAALRVQPGENIWCMPTHPTA